MRPPAQTVRRRAATGLRSYPWPGNVRELRNVIERLMIMVPGDTIAEWTCRFSTAPGGVECRSPAERAPLHEARDAFERDYILRALAGAAGNISRTADVLGVERSNLYRKKMRGLGGIAPTRRRNDRE